MCIFKCLPKELVNHIKFMAIEPAPTAPLIKEMLFANCFILALGDNYFSKLRIIVKVCLLCGNTILPEIVHGKR